MVEFDQKQKKFAKRWRRNMGSRVYHVCINHSMLLRKTHDPLTRTKSPPLPAWVSLARSPFLPGQRGQRFVPRPRTRPRPFRFGYGGLSWMKKRRTACRFGRSPWRDFARGHPARAWHAGRELASSWRFASNFIDALSTSSGASRWRWRSAWGRLSRTVRGFG